MKLIERLNKVTQRALTCRSNLTTALKFRNDEKIALYSYRLASLNSEVLDLTCDLLKRIEKSDPEGIISAAIHSDVQIGKDPAMNVYSIDRHRIK